MIFDSYNLKNYCVIALLSVIFSHGINYAFELFRYFKVRNLGEV